MITEFAQKYSMLPQGCRVLCAVSGGADSMCLLHWLHSNAQKLGISVFAAHFNHRLRGTEADRDQHFVEDWCEKNGVRCVSGSADVAAFAAENGLGTEDAARQKRYEFLYQAADELNCDVIATAHNSDDNAETLLINLIRGSGAKGLCGIPPVRGRLIRPLLGTCREQIEAYVRENNVPYVTDSSNLSDDYTRNILRHKVMPVLRGINPAFTASALRTTELLREDEAYLDAEAKRFTDEFFTDASLPLNRLRELPRPVLTRVLRTVCGRGLTAKQADAILGILRAEGLAHTDIGGMRVTKDRDRLYFGQKCQGFPDTALVIGQTLHIPDAGFTVSSEIISPDGEIFKTFNNYCFNYTSICGTIAFTTRRDGDRVRLAGRSCTKSLKDLFREAGLKQNERDSVPVLRDEKGIIAVYGFGVAERCRAHTGDTVLCIGVKKYKK